MLLATAALPEDLAVDDAVSVVRVHGELDLATAAGLRQELLEALLPVPARLVVDLADCPFLGATAVQLLMSAHLRAQAQGTRLTLRGCRPQARWVLRLCCVDDVLEQEPAQRDA